MVLVDVRDIARSVMSPQSPNSADVLVVVITRCTAKPTSTKASVVKKEKARQATSDCVVTLSQPLVFFDLFVDTMESQRAERPPNNANAHGVNNPYSRTAPHSISPSRQLCYKNLKPESYSVTLCRQNRVEDTRCTECSYHFHRPHVERQASQ